VQGCWAATARFDRLGVAVRLSLRLHRQLVDGQHIVDHVVPVHLRELQRVQRLHHLSELKELLNPTFSTLLQVLFLGYQRKNVE